MNDLCHVVNVVCHAFESVTSSNCDYTQNLLFSRRHLPLITNELLQRSVLTNVNVSQVPDGDQVWKIMKSPDLKSTLGNDFLFSFSLLRRLSMTLTDVNEVCFMSPDFENFIMQTQDVTWHLLSHPHISRIGDSS